MERRLSNSVSSHLEPINVLKKIHGMIFSHNNGLLSKTNSWHDSCLYNGVRLGRTRFNYYNGVLEELHTNHAESLP